MKFLCEVSSVRRSVGSMSNKWGILCALSLFALVGASRRERGHGGPTERLIFNELCAMKDDPGDCKAIKDRFFFNINTGRCEVFEYGGCGGNENNFETLEECEETCVVSDDKDPCHLPESNGPCRAMLSRYLFDSASQQCRHFYYGGCFGNANNFKSMAECQAKCQNTVKPTKASEVPTQATSRAMEVQPTVPIEKRAVIEPLIQANNTNALTADFSPSELCFSPLDRGTCHGAEKRFAYNPQTKKCHTFTYSGCGGNKNNFLLRKHCIHKCIGIKTGHGRKVIRIRKKNIESIVSRLD
ncbi:tissue factor pathway inhibitor a [Salarias fasciatus]|uniref:Tissue factor pathway inhibitor n=1 Tax=Salarias fasciatus TaxID=181472 RepID=A0A672IB18_SALFA|nr:tissue factor pathway inhibitor-like [Salarias fasciatus]